MSKKIYFIMVIEFLWLCIAWFFTFFALFFAKKIPRYDGDEIQRYKLPSFLRWMETPDEQLPGGIYEPEMADIYKKYGWFIAAWRWIGTRNTGGGIMWNQGKEVSTYLANMSDEEQKKFGVYEKIIPFYGLYFKLGWAVYKDKFSTKTANGFWAVPRFSVRLKSSL